MSRSIVRTSAFVVGALFASGAALVGIAAENSSVAFSGGAQVGFTNNSFLANTKFGQTFLAEETGKLQSIFVRGFYHNITQNTLHQSLRIDIFAVDAGNGLPFGPSLAGWDTPAADIPEDNTNGYLFVREGAPVHIVAGQSYAFIMGTAVGSNVDFTGPYAVGFTTDTYTGGRMAQWHQGQGASTTIDRDLSFEVAVPTPGAAAFFALAGLATLRRRAR